jgi:hypothetical protein
VAVIKPGRILFEIAGVREDAAREAMRLAAYKLPIPCRFVTRRENEIVEQVAEADTAVFEAGDDEIEDDATLDDGEEGGSDE